MAANNTAGFTKNGSSMALTFTEFRQRVKDRSTGKVETRTGEEIAEHMKNVLGKLGET